MFVTAHLGELARVRVERSQSVRRQPVTWNRNRAAVASFIA
jgi:hypothetical protein